VGVAARDRVDMLDAAEDPLDADDLSLLDRPGARVPAFGFRAADAANGREVERHRREDTPLPPPPAGGRFLAWWRAHGFAARPRSPRRIDPRGAGDPVPPLAGLEAAGWQASLARSAGDPTGQQGAERPATAAANGLRQPRSRTRLRPFVAGRGTRLRRDSRSERLDRPGRLLRASAATSAACRVRKFGRTSQKRLFAGKSEFASSLHRVVAWAVLI
jgi:hypothetical protein